MSPDELEQFDNRLRKLESKVDDIYNLLAKIDGAGMLIKITVWIGGPIFGIIYFFRDHWK